MEVLAVMVDNIEYCELNLVKITSKRQRKPKGQSRMENPKKLTTFGYTRHRTKANKTET